MTTNQPRKRWALRSGMLLALGLAFSLIFMVAETLHLFGVPFTSFAGLWANQEQEAMNNLSIIADARKKELERWVEERRTDILVHGENPSFQQDVQALTRSVSTGSKGNGEGAAARNRLRKHLGNIQQGYYGEYEKIELIDAVTGTILLSTNPEEEGADASQQVYFVETRNPAVEEMVMITRPEEKETTSLAFCRAIHGPSDKKDNVLAVLVFHNSMRNIITTLLHEGVGQTGEVVLVEQDGRLVAPLRYALPNGETASPRKFINQAKPAKLASQGIETMLAARDYRGVEVLAATRHLRVTSELGWGMVVKMDRTEALAPIVRAFFFNLAIVVGALLVCAGVMVVIVTHFTRPLAGLSQAASTIEAGDFTVRICPAGSREIWAVARAFNGMAKRIESWHAELTREVEERTHELLETNKSLLESEARFRSLFENIHVATLLIDPENGAIIDANAAAAAYYGWSTEQLRTMRLADIHPLSPEEIKAKMALTLAEGHGYFQFRHRMANGSLKDVEIYSGPIQVGGKTFLCSIVHDITQRKLDEDNRAQMEEQLRQAAKMEAVGRLAGGVAHDFNNMLSIILGYLDFLKEDFSTNSGVMHSLTEIEKAAHRSKDITRQLLGFSRKQTISPKPVDVNAAITETQRNLGRLMGEDVELIFRPGTDLWRILIDPSQIDQVLMNLAVNARDAMPAGGKFILETGNLIIDAAYNREHPEAMPGPYVVLTASDSGIGMDRDTLSHIFEPFFTTKEMGKGTGLGLATVFGIVRQNKGFINVYSESGQGTTFRIYLPRLEENGGTAQAADEEEVVDRGAGTILLVEDEEQVRLMTQRMLEGLGYGVIVAATPTEALNLCHAMSTAPDLLLTDVIMPGMSGREVCDILTAKWPEIRTVFMSGYTADLLAPHQVLAAGTHFLQKPFIRKDLARKVREAML